jgi:hypothetical protein
VEIHYFKINQRKIMQNNTMKQKILNKIKRYFTKEYLHLQSYPQGIYCGALKFSSGEIKYLKEKNILKFFYLLNRYDDGTKVFTSLGDKYQILEKNKNNIFEFIQQEENRERLEKLKLIQDL